MIGVSKRALIPLPAIVLLAACSSPPPERPVVVNTPPATVVSPPPVSGSTVAPRRLNAEEVAALVNNNTLAGMGRTGIPYEAYFGANGSERFRQGTLYDSGTWRVLPDGMLCVRLAQLSNGAERCYALAQYGDVTLFERPDGVAEGSVRMLPGNPSGI